LSGHGGGWKCRRLEGGCPSQGCARGVDWDRRHPGGAWKGTGQRLTGNAAILAAHEKAWASGWKGAKPAAHDERLGRDHRDHRDNREVPGMVLRAMKRLAGFALTNGAARQYSLRTGQ
jgi:hypothetical protein